MSNQQVLSNLADGAAAHGDQMQKRHHFVHPLALVERDLTTDSTDRMDQTEEPIRIDHP